MYPHINIDYQKSIINVDEPGSRSIKNIEFVIPC
jgi:hypothetical protein